MAPVTPSGEPQTARAGDTWTWARSFAEYPASEGWALSYELRGPATLTIGGAMVVATGDLHTVTVPATATAPLPAGSYVLVALLTGSGAFGGRRDSIDLGRLQVTPNPSAVVGGEPLSHAEKMLAQVETAIEDLVAGRTASYMIAGRQVTRLDMAELYRVRMRYSAEVARLRRPQSFGRRVEWTFGSPTP